MPTPAQLTAVIQQLQQNATTRYQAALAEDKARLEAEAEQAAAELAKTERERAAAAAKPKR